MNILTSDFEITTYNTGNPYDSRNKAVCVGIKEGDSKTEVLFEGIDSGLNFNDINLFVFFNAKYDLSWWRKCGQDISEWRVWCCQIAEFLLEGQRTPYPSLNDAASKYGFNTKIDIVATEYWDKGINTDSIPHDILAEYCGWDVDLTYSVYLRQVEQFKEKPQLYKLFRIWMEDLKVLQEMEWNGQIFDETLCLERAQENDIRLQELRAQLASVYPEVPINFNSGPQLSAFLYGGTITTTEKHHDGFFKTGQKKGQPKLKNISVEHVLPRLIEPLKNSEMTKAGVFATDEGTLRKLKGPNAKKYVTKLLEYAKLEKLNSTYYRGLPAINAEMHWGEREIHGQYNQCVAATGRLSSSKPNAQNFAGDCLDVFITRYPTGSSTI